MIFHFKEKWLIGVLFNILIVVSCQQKIQQNKKLVENKIDKKSVSVQAQLQFPFPAIPVTLTEPQARKSYLLIHYWDSFNFADTALVNNRNVTEQGFVNFIALLSDNTPDELVRESLKNWCTNFIAKDHARKILTQTTDEYLYNPNSPFYNEGLYGLYLETMLNVISQTDAMRSSYSFKLELVKRNNPGTKATDFTYVLPDGTRKTLLSTPVSGNRLLLAFYDPECESCHTIIQQMATDSELDMAVKKGKISVLAVYTEGNDEAWRKTLANMPEGWIIGTDHEAIKIGALYDLKAMPSLYLLDENKRVILKDAPYEKIHRTLE